MPEATLRVLCVAFAVVPGSSAHAPAIYGLAAALHANMDFVTLKAETLPHLERFGQAQMLRVPVGAGSKNAQRSTFSRAIRRQMESVVYDVVHVRGPVEGLVALEMRAAQGFKVIYEMGSYPDESDGVAAERGWAAAHMTCLEGADLVIVPSDAATRASAVRAYERKLHVVPPGVDVDAYDWRAFAPGPRAENVTRLLYLGSFGVDRDLGTLLGAVREVAKRFPIHVLLAGEPDPGRRQRVRRLVQAFELGDLVDVRGEPPPLLVPQIIAAAEICLAPAAASPRFQEHGDVPQPLLEYFAGRRAVVAAGVPAVSEVLRDEHEGLLYAPGDEAALTESILALLADTELREQIAAEGYARARSQLSAGARRRRLVEVYEALIPGSQRVDPWTTGFDNEGTGQWELPALASESTGSTQVPDSSDASGPPVLRTSPGAQETEVLMTMGTPMSGEPRSVTPPPLDLEELARFDTNPGLEGTDIPGAPTIIRGRIDTTRAAAAGDGPGERLETGELPSAGASAGDRAVTGEVAPTTDPGTSTAVATAKTAQLAAPPPNDPDTGRIRLPAPRPQRPSSVPPPTPRSPSAPPPAAVPRRASSPPAPPFPPRNPGVVIARPVPPPTPKKPNTD